MQRLRMRLLRFFQQRSHSTASGVGRVQQIEFGRVSGGVKLGGNDGWITVLRALCAVLDRSMDDLGVAEERESSHDLPFLLNCFWLKEKSTRGMCESKYNPK
jgi:hypothetical protein